MSNFTQSMDENFSGMFGNIGKKLQTFSYIFMILSFIGVIICMLFDVYGLFDMLGFLGLVIYALMFASALMFSWLIYGFGQLIDDIHQLAGKQDEHTPDFSDLPQL